MQVFEWDERKAASNYHKHGITFDEAKLAFADPRSIAEQDRTENREKRWLTIGMIDTCLIVSIAHTVHEHGHSETIRIINARKATRKERDRYYGNR